MSVFGFLDYLGAESGASVIVGLVAGLLDFSVPQNRVSMAVDARRCFQSIFDCLKLESE
jgi:hypothetical protein